MCVDDADCGTDGRCFADSTGAHFCGVACLSDGGCAQSGATCQTPFVNNTSTTPTCLPSGYLNAWFPRTDSSTTEEVEGHASCPRRAPDGGVGCTTGNTLCAGTCTNLDLDPHNCGACGQASLTGVFWAGNTCLLSASECGSDYACCHGMQCLYTGGTTSLCQ